MKKLLFLCFVLSITLSAYGQRQVIDKVVATIGGELILLSDIEEQHALAKDQNGGNLPEDIRCDILSGLVINNLLLNQSKLDSIEVSDEEVESQLNARIDQILEYMQGNVQQFEDYYGQPINEVKDRFRADLRDKLLTERMQGQVMSSITVTPAEVKAFYARIPVDSLPYFNAEVEVGEIVYKPVINAEERKKSVDKLIELRHKIVEGGESFQELAKIHSDDGSSQVGGDLGWAKRGKFVPAFEAAAYKLKAGEVSAIVKSEFGYHIIQMIERRGNRIHARHILKRPEITDEDVELARQHMDSVRQLIQTDSLSFSFAVKKFSSDKTQSFNNDGRMINPTTGNTFFEIGDLDPDVYFALDTLQLSEVSAPFEFQLPPSDTYFRLIQLQARTPPHKANLRQDYSKIKEAAIQAKKNEFLNGWVTEKAEGTYFAVDAMYEGCPSLQAWKKHKLR